MKIALVCDWLTTPGGAEKVLLELHKMYPNAPIYTSQYSKKGINWFDDAEVKTGWLQIFPASLRKFLGPLRQIYFSHLDLSDYDLVISVTGAEAKSIKTYKKDPNLSLYHTYQEKSIDISKNSSKKGPTTHICYCHVPTQYYWQMYDKYLENPGFGILDPLVRLAFKLLVKPLRQADYRAAQQPDQFITISDYAKDQIQKYYNREAIVVAPPVEVEKFSSENPDFSTKKTKKSTRNPQESSAFSTENTRVLHKKSTTFPQEESTFSTKSEKISTTNSKDFHNFSTTSPQVKGNFPNYHYETGCKVPQIIYPIPRKYYIIACRQVNWKRVDLAIKACKKLKLPLLVVGDGPERLHLLQIAGESQLIKFLPWATTDELACYLQGAKGYIFPSLEPFGIAAVEALAAGCPVIAFAEGGSKDFIKPSENGILFDQQTPESLVKALQKFEKLSFDREKVARTATKFSRQHFDQGIEKAVAKIMSTASLKHSPQATKPKKSPKPKSKTRNTKPINSPKGAKS